VKFKDKDDVELPDTKEISQPQALKNRFKSIGEHRLIFVLVSSIVD